MEARKQEESLSKETDKLNGNRRRWRNGISLREEANEARKGNKSGRQRKPGSKRKRQIDRIDKL